MTHDVIRHMTHDVIGHMVQHDAAFMSDKSLIKIFMPLTRNLLKLYGV